MDNTIAVIGMGYVGLPLALAFEDYFPVIGYDREPERIKELKNGIDSTDSVIKNKLENTTVEFTAYHENLADADIYIICVPTPIDDAKKPDLSCVESASIDVGSLLSKNNSVVYESTVYPGATEEICIPILEKQSGLKAHEDFSVAYSPERLNPGDPHHSLKEIVKVVAANDEQTMEKISELYSLVVPAGIHPVKEIRVGEASKIIENAQRDLNIALVNELAIIFERLNINTSSVLKAASTKWNFLPFEPGLVGGHCIGVDPYYLTYKAEQLGYHPQVILSGRRINDGMGKYVAEITIKKLANSGRAIKGATVALLGLTFKENCPDLRNSQVQQIFHELRDYGIQICLHDPLISSKSIKTNYGQLPVEWSSLINLDAVILCTPHDYYKQQRSECYSNMLKPGGVLLDLKACVDKSRIEKSINVWSL